MGVLYFFFALPSIYVSNCFSIFSQDNGSLHCKVKKLINTSSSSEIKIAFFGCCDQPKLLGSTLHSSPSSSFSFKSNSWSLSQKPRCNSHQRRKPFPISPFQVYSSRQTVGFNRQFNWWHQGISYSYGPNINLGSIVIFTLVELCVILVLWSLFNCDSD